MDLARVDLMNRAGLAKQVAAHNWYPVVVAETIRFRKSLELFDAFTIETRIVGWDEKAFLLEQKFFRRGVCMAEAVVRARFLKKAGGSVSTEDFLKLTQIKQTTPELPQWIKEWNQNQI